MLSDKQLRAHVAVLITSRSDDLQLGPGLKPSVHEVEPLGSDAASSLASSVCQGLDAIEAAAVAAACQYIPLYVRLVSTAIKYYGLSLDVSHCPRPCCCSHMQLNHTSHPFTTSSPA